MTTTYRVLGATITITTTHNNAEQLVNLAWLAVGVMSSVTAIVIGYSLGSM